MIEKLKKDLLRVEAGLKQVLEYDISAYTGKFAEIMWDWKIKRTKHFEDLIIEIKKDLNESNIG